MLKQLSRIICLGLALTGAAHAAEPINTTTFGNLAVDGYDVVAYQTDHRAVKGKSDFRTEWHDAKWQFASAEHLQAFRADPQRYAPQYGGYCAYAVADKRLVDIDPEAFTIVDGKLYLNYSRDIQKKWSADRANYIEKADRNWPALSR
ncbi:YHS domain-containing (seleno)protein [Solimonas terrae]|uniref:YHS domain-containing protein n=1 Tax=Solimonas terrae TaxID=1396819 RepID=A0A6M2BTK9_9GAMM|nr:YHS domain-containing (seleno)protein [Solimonas terrae]NGY05453.1 YHS domain-containing protein [Solimonas terrae]